MDRPAEPKFIVISWELKPASVQRRVKVSSGAGLFMLHKMSIQRHKFSYLSFLPPSPYSSFSCWLIWKQTDRYKCGWDLAECEYLAELWKRSSHMWMRSSRVWMRSNRVVRASGCQCLIVNSPGFAPSILRHSGIWGAADEAVLDNVHEKRKNLKNPPLKNKCAQPKGKIFPTPPLSLCSGGR